MASMSKIRTIKLTGSLGPLTFLRVELTNDASNDFAIIRYSLSGKEQTGGLRLDLNKRTFLDLTGVAAVDTQLPQIALQVLNAIGDRGKHRTRRPPYVVKMREPITSERFQPLSTGAKTKTFLGFDSTSLSRLATKETIELFRKMLWCSARRHSLPIQSITISLNVNAPDGGIDACVAPNTINTDQDLLISGNSYFQIKAGDSSTPWQKSWLQKELFGNVKKHSKAALGKAVQNCLAHNGRYVIVCFGIDPTDSQRRKSIKYLRELFAACGYKHAQVDVWGQGTLAGLIHQFPSIELQLSNRHQLPFSTHDEWKLDSEMGRSLHLGNAQKEIIDVIRNCLRGTEVYHVRLIGEPGLGKTRLALQALSAEDLAPTVIYVRHPEDFQQGPLFNEILRADNISSMTLVIDDCSEKERASIWNVLRQRRDRIRLITLDQGPEKSADDLMQVFECPALDKEQIKAILAEYIGMNPDTNRWIDFCSGSPRVAHAVGENLRRNPDDVLKPTATVPLWERFIQGNSKTGSQDESEKETALRHIALFHKFGFEHPVDGEAKFISSMIEIANPAITWQRFQSIIKDFRDRRILQGKTTLFIVPKLLHIYYWCQFWEHYGPGTDISNLISRMPQSLFRWFTEMFKYGHVSQSCLTRIEIITSSGGPFDKREFLISGQGCVFLNELAEANPEATLRCLERTIGNWSRKELFELRQSRQYLVWALEKIAIWKNLFQRAATVLLKLALAENAPNSNNAIGTFCDLFTMGYDRFASSEAPPELRLPVLRTALESSDHATRMLALKAIDKNLDNHPHTKIGCPEYQGMRQLPALWRPKTYGELFNAYRSCWQLVVGFHRTATGVEKTTATKVMIDAAFGLVQNRWIEKEILVTLEKLAVDPETDLRPIVRLISRFRVLHWKNLSRNAAKKLHAIDNRIRGTTIESQIKRMVLLANHDDIDRGEGSQYGNKYRKKLTQLARSAMSQPEILKALLPDLLSQQEGFALISFGQAWGNEDQSLEWWPTILEQFTALGGQRNPELMAGYLGSIFKKNRERWQLIALQILEDRTLVRYAKQLILGSGMTEVVMTKLCTAIEGGTVSAEVLSQMGYFGKAYGLSTEQLVGFISWCAKQGTFELMSVGLTAAYALFCTDKDAPPIPEKPLLQLLTAPNVLHSRTPDLADYEWSELTKRFVEAYPQHSMRIIESVLNHFDDFEFVLAFSHSQAQTAMLDLVRRERHGAWLAVINKLNLLNGTISHNLQHWLNPGYKVGENTELGVLNLFDINDILVWIDEDPKVRAPFIARVCPKTLNQHEGGRLTREILHRYGDQAEVKNALWVNFGTESWIGSASSHYRNKRDQMREWLSKETVTTVIRWLEEYIDYLGNEIKRNEISEEREY